MNKTVSLFLIIACCCGCSSKPATEKHQSKRDNIINVHDRIKEIVIDNVYIGSYPWVQIIDNYLFIQDHRPVDEYIHIFYKNNFKYVRSTAPKGQGPGEITRVGYIVEDKVNRKFYVTDHGRNKIFSYDLDSVIDDPAYIPVDKMKINEQLHPWDYVYINDTLSIGVIVEIIGNSDFRPVVGRFNMKTGETSLMSYTGHPDIKKKRMYFGISIEDGIYVECYSRHDLMTICSLDGELMYNIYGPDWDTETHRIDHYGRVNICCNRIVALYSGQDSFTKDGRSTGPTKFIVFDLYGNYLKTLETGYQIVKFCYDKENNRFIMSMDDEIQFAYLDLDGLLD